MLKAVYTDTDDLNPQEGIDKLTSQGFEVVRLETHDKSKILDAARDAHAVLLGYAEIDADMLKEMKNLEIISLLSTGYDNVALASATEKGVCVANIGATSAEEVATHALTLLLACARGLPLYQNAAKTDQWFKTPYPHVPPRLSSKRVGILGFGNIGKRFAQFIKPLVQEIVFYDPAITQSAHIEGVRQVDLPELVSTSDFISIHMPLSPATYHLFDANQIAKMKKDSYLINVSRGGLVDSKALIAALDSGHLAGAALDVSEVEPPKNSDPLLSHPKIIMTPHVAYLSQYSIAAYIDVQSENVIQWFTGQEVSNSVNGIRRRK